LLLLCATAYIRKLSAASLAHDEFLHRYCRRICSSHLPCKEDFGAVCTNRRHAAWQCKPSLSTHSSI
jgi:hypothetical protein